MTSVDLLRAYDALPLTQQGYDGQGETVVLMEVGGFLESDFDHLRVRREAAAVST